MTIQQIQRRIAKLERQRERTLVHLAPGGVPLWMRNGAAPPPDIPCGDPVEFTIIGVCRLTFYVLL